MTDEERKRLCQRLCEPPKNDDEDVHRYELCVNAANEIERLAEHVKKLINSEPVAWRWRWHSDPPDVWNFADKEFRSELVTNEPLYTAKPPALIS